MSHTSNPPEPPQENTSLAELKALELLRRSPHPYHRRQSDLRGTDTSSSSTNALQCSSVDPTRSRSKSPISSDDDGRKRRKTVGSPSDSGTEADDEGIGLVKALPAPPIRPRKGLRDTRGDGHDSSISPLLTPTQLDENGRRFSAEFLRARKEGSQMELPSPTDDEARKARQKYLRRRRAEVTRRATETVFLAVIGLLVIRGCNCWQQLLRWHRELLTYATVLAGLLALYPLRLLYYSSRRDPPSYRRLRQRIRIPASFDPAPILYPATIPAFISISLLSGSERLLLLNLTLSLAALPPQLMPFGKAMNGYSVVHWFISVLPLIASQNTEFPSKLFPDLPYLLKLPPPQGLDPELLVLLFPLHQALLPPLHYLTTTSLLPAELHLLSIGLINVLLFADSPQAEILRVLLWIGGLGVFVLCGKVLKWGVALARIPRWRFRRAGQVIRAQQSFLQILDELIKSRRFRAVGGRDPYSDSDADEDHPRIHPHRRKAGPLNLSPLDVAKTSNALSHEVEIQSAIEHATPELLQQDHDLDSNMQSLKRRNTLPNLSRPPGPSNHATRSRRRAKSVAQAFLSLTPTQALVRKWLYAGYFYVTVILLVLIPIRYLIEKWALHGHEPVGWAIGYMLGNIQRLRFWIIHWDMENWIVLPPMHDPDDARWASPLGIARYIQHFVFGEANTRLLLCGHFLAIIGIGLLVVFRLSSVVEVDTRRKVFHGMMVAMLLPTIYIDPTFISLALAIVLAVFLLLDLIRASQLPPLSQPIARFLTPYVDGRDLRGPVVISHIFLLIGCAIPLWLALAGIDRTGQAPWEGWDVAHRDVSMVAGVVCVGMGDAAASLIGRRYGRRKWPWQGGKSLEGSLAFALAVMLGLVFGKVWLEVGQFNLGGDDLRERPQPQSGTGFWNTLVAWFIFLAKATACAVGASLNEAVLTGGNDNVVVPVILWLLVRGVGL